MFRCHWIDSTGGSSGEFQLTSLNRDIQPSTFPSPADLDIYHLPLTCILFLRVSKSSPSARNNLLCAFHLPDHREFFHKL